MDKIGVAFAGGGGKGGYQVGVCKALSEFGITPSFVSGTSVGALNGSLYAQGRIEVAERIWKNIRRENVLDLSLNRILLQLATQAGARLVSAGLATTASVVKLCAALSLLKTKRRGLFSQNGLLAMMEEAFADQPLSSLGMPFWAAVHDRAGNQVDYLTVQDRTEEDARKLLLASAALPYIFDDIELDGKVYSDGGWFWGLPHKRLDNNPVAPLYDAGCTTIILICLNRDDLIDRRLFPHARILPIVPGEDLGGIFDGVMDFSSEGAVRRIEQGYNDAWKLLSHLKDFIENEAEYERLWQGVLQDEEATAETAARMEKSGTDRIDLKRSIHEFNRIVFDDKLEGELTVDLPDETNLLDYANRLLIEKLDRQEMLKLQDGIRDYIDRNRDSAADLQQAALEALSFLSPTIPQSDALADQRLFARLWNGITGKDLKLLAQNQRDLAQAQFASLALMQHLQTKNLITLHFTAAVNSKLNLMFAEVAILQEEMNRTTYDTYRSLALVWCKTRNLLKEQKERIARFENRLVKIEWLGHLKTRSWRGTHYHDLGKVQRLVCVVNDFFIITRGAWNDGELLTLEAALHDLDLLHEEIAYTELLTDCLNDRLVTHRLITGLCRASTASPDVALLETASALQTGAGTLAIPPTAWESKLPAFHLALDLLGGLRQAGYSLREGKRLCAAKAALVERLARIKAAAESYNCYCVLPEIETLRDQIESFRFTVPLIGPFSAGKSSLLNRYLGFDQPGELLKTNVTPTTAVAAELHWTGGEDKVIERFYDGSQRSFPLSQLRHHAAPLEGLFCREIHLGNPKLAQHPDLVLVDMPGLGSGDNSHDKAIASYVGGDATAFILCLTQESGTLKESERRFLGDSDLFDLDLGLVINLTTPQDDETVVTIARQVRQYSRKDEIDVVTLNALNGDMLDGFSAMLKRLDTRKDGILRNRFAPAIDALGSRVVAQLRFLLNGENLSAEELKRRKTATEKAARELEEAFSREQEKLLYDCTRNLPDAVAGAVHCALAEQLQPLFETAKNGGKIEDRIRGLAGGAYQAALARAARERFARTAQELQRYVAAFDVVDGATTAGFDAQSLPEVSIGLGSIGIGTTIAWIIFGPLGGIVAGIAGFFMKKRQEEELKAKLREAFEEIRSQARSEAARQLPEMAGRFLSALQERLQGTLNQQQENIRQLEAQLAGNRQQDEERKREIQQTITALSS